MNHNIKRPTMIGNTKEATAILEAISKFGCISIEQAAYFMPQTLVKRENYHEIIINYLVSSKQVIRQDDIICSLNQKYGKPEIIDSIWAMIEILEKLSTSDLHISELLEESFNGNKPETIGFILNSNKVIRIIPVFSSGDITNILFSQERYYSTGHNYGDEENSDLIYYFVLRDTKLLQNISKLNLTYPYKIAFLADGETTRPSIKLLQPPKKG